MQNHAIYILVVLGVLATDRLFADQTSFLLLGTSNKASSGAGMTQTNGMEAVGQNPSALGIGKPHPISCELAFVSLRYSYSVPDYNPAVVTLNSPMIFLGGSYDLPARMTIGWSIMPIPGGSSKLEVDSVPTRAVSETPSIIDVSTENTAPLDYKLAAGLSWSPQRRIHLGLSAKTTKAEIRTKALESENGETLIDLSSTSSSMVYLAGATLFLPWNIRLGAAFQSTTRIALKGKSNNEGGSNFSSMASLGDGFGIGVEGGMPWLSGFTEMRIDRRKRDKGVTDPIMLAGAGVLDRRDTRSHVVGIKSRLRNHRLTASYGWTPSAIGDGIMASLDEDKTEYFGVGFGDLNAISRHHYGIGDEWTWGKMTIKESISVTHGNRSVPTWSRGSGFYQLRIYTISGSLDWRI